MAQNNDDIKVGQIYQENGDYFYHGNDGDTPVTPVNNLTVNGYPSMYSDSEGKMYTINTEQQDIPVVQQKENRGISYDEMDKRWEKQHPIQTSIMNGTQSTLNFGSRYLPGVGWGLAGYDLLHGDYNAAAQHGTEGTIATGMWLAPETRALKFVANPYAVTAMTAVPLTHAVTDMSINGINGNNTEEALVSTLPYAISQVPRMAKGIKDNTLGLFMNRDAANWDGNVRYSYFSDPNSFYRRSGRNELEDLQEVGHFRDPHDNKWVEAEANREAAIDEFKDRVVRANGYDDQWQYLRENGLFDFNDVSLFSKGAGANHGVVGFSKRFPFGSINRAGQKDQPIIFEGTPSFTEPWFRTGFHGRYSSPKMWNEIEDGKGLATRLPRHGRESDPMINAESVSVFSKNPDGTYLYEGPVQTNKYAPYKPGQVTEPVGNTYQTNAQDFLNYEYSNPSIVRKPYESPTVGEYDTQLTDDVAAKYVNIPRQDWGRIKTFDDAWNYALQNPDGLNNAFDTFAYLNSAKKLGYVDYRQMRPLFEKQYEQIHGYGQTFGSALAREDTEARDRLSREAAQRIERNRRNRLDIYERNKEAQVRSQKEDIHNNILYDCTFKNIPYSEYVSMCTSRNIEYLSPSEYNVRRFRIKRDNTTGRLNDGPVHRKTYQSRETLYDNEDARTQRITRQREQDERERREEIAKFNEDKQKKMAEGNQNGQLLSSFLVENNIKYVKEF